MTIIDERSEPVCFFKNVEKKIFSRSYNNNNKNNDHQIFDDERTKHFIKK